MTSTTLDNLVNIGKLKQEPADQIKAELLLSSIENLAALPEPGDSRI